MSNRKLAKTIQNLSREVQRLYRNFNRGIVNWLLRSAFVAHRRGQSPVAGFVLPVVTLLLLVVTLTVGAMTLRAFDRNVQVIAESQQKVIYNAATPAIDRARSKLEFLFDISKETRYPGGVPPESQLLTLMTNASTPPLAAGTSPDAYTLPGEVRVDVGEANGTAVDNVWRYRADTDGDGQNDSTVLYSIIFRTPTGDPGGDSAAAKLLSLSDAAKAADGIVRGGPISNQSNLTGCGSNNGGGGDALTAEAWFEDQSNSSRIRKNFQIDAIVIPDKAKAAAVTLEFQQDRQIQRGNKWGAWFRSDLEVFPGANFNWNGAMHTEGSLMLGQSQDNKIFTAYLISSPASCLYQKESSEISATKIEENVKDPTNTIPKFVGHAAFGMIGSGSTTGTAKIYVHPDGSGDPADPEEMSKTTVKVSNEASLATIASNPTSIVLTENSRSVANGVNETGSTWNNFDKTILGKRIINKSAEVPYVDDLYRADNRYGPKAKYKDPLPTGKKSGDPITAGDDLVKNDGDPVGVGLDGYWERRARTEGLRLLVGERLELGNIGGWQTPKDLDGDGYVDRPTTFDPAAPVSITANTDRDGDPLYPITVKPYPVNDASVKVPHLTQQRRSLRDNLPAVQAAAVYHSAVGSDKDYPVACLAMTIHPGTVDTLRQSTNFMPTKFASGATGAATAPEYLLSDFFTGRGTDGWEFSTPGGTATTIASALGANQPLRIALENLANFAGDPKGAFPPTQDDVIHPYPALSMWGNFSNLRRALDLLKAGSYAALSPADKTYIHTAACSLGMLAYEVDQVQKFDTTNGANNTTWNNGSKKVLTDLSDRLALLMNGDVTDGEVLSKAQLATYRYNPAAADVIDPTGTDNLYNPRDYDNVPPEAYIAALKQKDILSQVDYLNDPVIRMAEMIMLNHQIRRDRTFGFRPSPAFGEYALVKDSAVHLFPTACDPDLFALEDTNFVAGPYPIAGAPTIVPSTGLLPLDATGVLKPFKASYATVAELPGAVTGAFNKLSGRRLALSRLCGGLRVPTGYYDPKTKPAVVTATGVFNPAARPVVMPKFPSLYYIFPEVEHGLKGATATTWDHRQPGAIDATVPAAFTAAPRPAALDPAQIANLNRALPADEATFVAASATAQSGLDPYDREPYIVDPYVTTALGTNTFKPVTATVARAAYPTPAAVNLNPENRGALTSTSQFLARFPYAGSSPLPTADLSLGTVGSLILAPRQIAGFPAGATAGVLPNYEPIGVAKNQTDYGSPNRIQVPKTPTATDGISNLSQDNMPTKAWAVPFLDRAMFDGRQLQVARMTDIDLAMLRSNKPGSQGAGNEFAPNDTWLPMSGVVYGFREDAVREDAIARPIGGSVTTALGDNPSDADLTTLNATLTLGTATNVTLPASPYDPANQSKGISIKAIDHVPDPDRRVHGFRLRNGEQLKRNTSVVAANLAVKNTRGLSFFTDQPVYVQGDFNLHQDGDDDTNGTILEEFTQKLFAAANPPIYDKASFYTNRTTRDSKFAKPTLDRWRPSEILADAVSILSINHCDGSIADTFTTTTEDYKKKVPTYKVGADKVPELLNGSFKQSVYVDPGNSGGLYLYGCENGSGTSSFSNQNRVKTAPSSAQQGWDWKREGASFVTAPIAGENTALGVWSDFTTPVQIGRLGEALLEARPIGGSPLPPPLLPVNYSLEGFGPNNEYVEPGLGNTNTEDGRNDGFNGRILSPVGASTSMRMNSIIVGGIPPSRELQSYGGMHNFPRFLQMWKDANFIYSGSFVQLNFSNYATGPFEQEAWEPGDGTKANNGTSTAQKDRQFYPPKRLWGYDVALQFAPAGPAAARFVTPLATRSEFYTEPPVTDPYIKRLCTAARGVVPAGTSVNCPA